MTHLIYDIIGGIAIVFCVMVAIRCAEDVLIARKEND